MEKCWFVLHQTHYPAPEYAHQSMAHGAAEGPILLGHLLPSPKAVDQVINLEGITPFPRDMRVWATAAVDFRLSRSKEQGINVSSKAGVPIAAAAGITVNGEAGAVFRRMMGDSWAIDRLDRQIVQPTLTYLEQCRTSPQVAAWIEKNKTLGSWKAYMVTGLIIARGAKSERKDTKENEMRIGGGVDVPGVATAEAAVKHLNKDEVETSGQHITDFVWAIRLTEVSKRWFSSDLSQKTLSKGSVFAPKSETIDPKAVLSEEGLDGQDVHALEVFNDDEQEFFITMDGY
ncbi:hypothetical protein GQ53DRAFT_789686 [Thozetella sp. PMI_491]|nr:hypothetical protein GQ53DRAFT_789686 [Thozetella sp. PMI_491]